MTPATKSQERRIAEQIGEVDYDYLARVIRKNKAHKKNIREMQARIRDQRLIILEQEEKIAAMTRALLERAE